MWRFNAPPGWPQPPSDDWLPPPGWQPDPAWPAPPADWVFYLPAAESSRAGWRPGPVALVFGALYVAFWGLVSMFLPLTSDACGTTATCDYDLMDRAWLGTWGAEAGLLIVIGALILMRRRWTGAVIAAYVLALVAFPTVVIAGYVLMDQAIT
jgi:hypothetical protein